MYGAKEVMILTGYKESKARNVIKKLQEQLKKESPNYIPLSARIPIYYFNKNVLCIDSEESQIKKVLKQS